MESKDALVEQGQFPNKREAYLITGGLLIGTGAVIAGGIEETPKSQVERLLGSNTYLRTEIKNAQAAIKSNRQEIKSIKAGNPSLETPDRPAATEVGALLGLAVLAVAGLSWASRHFKFRRYQREAIRGVEK